VFNNKTYLFFLNFLILFYSVFILLFTSTKFNFCRLRILGINQLSEVKIYNYF